MYALDTNTVVHAIRGAGRVKQRLLATPRHEVAMPSLVVYELEVGTTESVTPSRRRVELDVLTSTIKILPFTFREAKLAARLRLELEARGTPIGPMDVLIAATALAAGATLVTHNTGEFGRIHGLRLDDWY